ncbi:MAG: MFS transporter [Myxococcota bacterium]
MNWLRATFAALQVRHFRILWIGTLLSFMAFFMSTIVQSVVAFELLATNRAVGFVVAGQGIAMVLFGPIGGAFADRLPKKLLVAIGQLLAMTIFLLLSLAVATETIRITFLTAGSFVMGMTFAFLGPARQALVIELVPEDRRGNAMALSQIANTASRVFGPALAAALLGWSLFGAGGAYAVMSGLYGFSASTLLLLPRSPGRSDAKQTHVLADLSDGLHYVWRHPKLRVLVFFFVAVITVGFPHVTVLPGLVENQLGHDVQSISWLYLASALGALGASLSVAGYADSDRALAIYVGLGLLFGLALLGLALAPNFGFAIAAMFFVGAGSGGFQSLSAAVVVREADPSYIGRVMSLTMLAFGFFGLMALPVGFMADAIGERAALLVTGAGVCALIAALRISLARLEP